VKQTWIPSGYILVAGPPNTGKSSLFNAMTGLGISPVSERRRTTTFPITGICSAGGSQACFVDMPPLEADTDTDPRWKDADSRELLRHVWVLIKARGCKPANLDATIVCQAPKLRPYIDQMRANIAADLGADISDISVKATTEEGLGISGSGGIAAHCVVLLQEV